MKTKTITCPCGEVAEVECVGSTVSIAEARAAGWGFAWDIRNGLDMRLLCGACAKRVADLATEIARVVGTDSLSFSQLLSADHRPRTR